MADETQWDPAAVVGRASELIQSSNYEKVSEARADVDAVLGEWVRATQALPEGSSGRALAVSRVADLWGRYAQLEIGLRQFKQATKVFESAVGCAVTCEATSLWLQYAAFCVDRKKLSNARKVFARAIHAVPEAEREQVWTRFHAFVHEHIDSNVTLEALQAQVQAAPLGTPSARTSPTNGTALPSDQQVAIESADVPSTSVAAAPAADTAAAAATAPTASTSPTAATISTADSAPSPLPEGVAEPAEACDGAVDTAASTAQASSSDSADAAGALVGTNTVEQPADAAEGSIATPEVAVEAAVDSEPNAPADKEVQKIEETPELVVDGGNALAFVDKTGQESVPPELEKVVDSDPTPAKRAGPADGANDEGANKRAKVGAEPSAPPGQAEVKAEPLEEPADFLLQVPKALPVITECPHLLFDPLTNEDGGINKAAGSELPNELVERLSDALTDSAVFQGVRELCTNQEQRDRDTLHRWQELVRMQMRERSELYDRQAKAEERLGQEDTRGQIELKMKHLEQRHDFVSRCLTSQKQFLNICAMDRTSALRAQQISLENMKIPEIVVTSDPVRINQQRAIVSVILEAEKLWREDRGAGGAGTKPKKEPAAEQGEVTSPQPPEKRRSARDGLGAAPSHSAGTRTGGYGRDSSTRGGRGGYRRDGGRGGSWDGGRGGGRGGFRRDDSRPYAGRGGGDRYRRDPRRDPRRPYYDSRDAGPPSRSTGPGFDAGAGASGTARFDPAPQRPPRMQEEYDPYDPQFPRPARQQEPQGYYPGPQAPPPIQYAPTPGSYDAYGRRRDTLPPPRAAYAQQAPAPAGFAAPHRYPQDPRRPRPDDRYNGPPPSAVGAEWQRPGPHSAPYQERQAAAPPQQAPYRRRDPLPAGDRVVEYAMMPEGEYRPPPLDPHAPRYGAPPRVAPGQAPHQPAPLQQQRYPRPQDMGPGPASQPPPYDAYSPYDYAPAQQQQPPPLGERGAPPFDAPQGFANGRGGFAPPPQRPAYQPYDQPPPEASFGYRSPADPRGYGRGGYDRGRRGGGPRQFRR